MIKETAADPLFGILLTVIIYIFSRSVYLKWKKVYFHPVITSGVSIAFLLWITRIPYSSYMSGGSVILQVLPVAAVFLAVPLYQKISEIKKYFPVIMISITAGSIAGILSIIWLGRLLGIDDKIIASLISKSATMPLALSVTAKTGGDAGITAIGVVLTGISGILFSGLVFKVLRVRNTLSRGLALGTSAHILGTGKALEEGREQGSLSTLAMVIAGIIVAFTAPLVYSFF